MIKDCQCSGYEAVFLSFSAARVAWAVIAWKSVSKSVIGVPEERVTAIPLRWGSTSSKDRQDSPWSSKTVRSSMTVPSARACLRGMSRSSAAVWTPTPLSFFCVCRPNAPDVSNRYQRQNEVSECFVHHSRALPQRVGFSLRHRSRISRGSWSMRCRHGPEPRCAVGLRIASHGHVLCDP